MESSSRGTRKDETEETGIFDLICKKKREISSLFSEIDKKYYISDKISLGPSGPTIYDTEIHEIRIREVNDKWKLEFDKLLAEKV